VPPRGGLAPAPNGADMARELGRVSAQRKMRAAGHALRAQ